MCRFSSTYAQYQLVLKNDTLIANNQYDFDILIKSNLGKINLTGYQIILTLNDSISLGGNLDFNYIENSSKLTNLPDVNAGIISDDGILNLAVGSKPGNDTISENYVKLGSFRLANSKPFGEYKTNIQWDFSGYVKSEISINDTDRTIPSNYINMLSNPVLVVGIIDKKITLTKFELFQNYPNPFNPGTVIRFTLPKEEKTVLTIYNILGEKIVTLLNQIMSKGSHTIKFDGTRFASGVYIYTLKTKDFNQSKQMILLK